MSTQPIQPNQKTLGQAVGQSARNVFNRTLGRLFGAGLNKGAEKGIFGGNPGTASWRTRSGATDWRVKLTIPPGSSLNAMFFEGSNKQDYKILGELLDTNGIIFPITPSVIMQHTANYSQLATTHANYPYYAYQNSEPANMTIVGEFPVQNQTDAAYWVGTIHFLRSVTKMFFGTDGTKSGEALRGNPPPILQFNGYGDHVFKNIPVIVTNWTCELRSDVDYIATSQNAQSFQMASRVPDAVRGTGTVLNNNSSNIPATWAPSLSTITVQIQPIYSRDSIKQFSLQKFVTGELNNVNGIGFI